MPPNLSRTLESLLQIGLQPLLDHPPRFAPLLSPSFSLFSSFKLMAFNYFGHQKSELLASSKPKISPSPHSSPYFPSIHGLKSHCRSSNSLKIDLGRSPHTFPIFLILLPLFWPLMPPFLGAKHWGMIPDLPTTSQ